MSRNKVQFQKSMSIHSFIEKFGSEQQCREHLFALRWPNGFHCPYCGHDQYCQLKSRALYQCNQCHHQSSLVAGTLFEGTKLPLRLWFLAIYLVTAHKKGISSLQLGRDLNVTQKTAWFVLQRLREACGNDLSMLKGIVGACRSAPVRWACVEGRIVASVCCTPPFHSLNR